MSDPAALTVALVGGQFHLGSGAVLDTRQRIGTDGEDLILRDVLSSSPHWWRAAKDFAEAVMTDTGDPKAWAFVYAGRTLRTYKPDAPPKRTRLSTVLDGAPQLRDPKKFGGEGSTIEADRSNKKFKILDAPLRIPDLRYSVPPTVVISTLPSQSYMASTIQEELQWILGHWPSSVFVLPHTRGIQEHLVEMDWFDRSAVSDQLASEMVAHETIPSSDPWIESLIEADPTTTQADLQITGFIDHGKWASAADLQAAWEFVEVRYDLQYNASKHGVIGLVKCMAIDHADDGIRVNAVCPGMMDTPMLQDESPENLKLYSQGNLLRRAADPAEIAQTIVHLASDESSFTTGAVVMVDGGGSAT